MSHEDPRATLSDLVAAVRAALDEKLLGLYLFGSLATGGFYPGRSDLDVIAVLTQEVTEQELDSLRHVHEAFENEHPCWRDRIEVLYISRAVLATFAETPTGTVARISPGEPLHFRDLDGNLGWLMDWHGAINGETLFGPPPLDVGPPVSDERFRAGVTQQLHDLRQDVRENTVAYVPAYQGYIAATVCRALFTLETGRQTSKAEAIEWAAARYPDSVDYLRSAYAAYRADIREPHERLISFVDRATSDSER